MEDIRIYDFEFNLLHIEHDIKSSNWSLYENDIGNFELHFPLTSNLVNVMMKNTYLVAVQGAKQAIITGKQVTTEGILYGRTCNWILTRFVTPEEFNTTELKDSGKITSKDALHVCKYIISLMPKNTIVFGESGDTFGKEVEMEGKGISNIFDLIQKCTEKAGGGHKVVFDIPNKRWVLHITKGKRLNLVISEGNRNAYETEYSEDIQNYISGGWYMQEMEVVGDWIAATNEPKLIDEATENFAKAYRVKVVGEKFDIEFEEGDYIVCKTKDGKWQKAEKAESFPVRIEPVQKGIYAWESELEGSNEKEARESLGEKTVEKISKTKTRKLFYEKDYALGDSVAVEIIKGDFATTEDKKITGVKLWYEENDVGEQPIMEE